ncbi:exosporium leader peptide-containing protein [Bacillus thuringiensis]
MSGSEEFLFAAALDPKLVGPTLPPIPPFTLPTGPTGSTGFLTSNYALIGNTASIGTITNGTPIPLNVNAVGPVGTNISHVAGSPDVILQPGVYSVEYSASPVDGVAGTSTIQGVQLSLNTSLLSLTDSYVISADSPTSSQALNCGGIIVVTVANSILNLVLINGNINFIQDVSLRIFQIS